MQDQTKMGTMPVKPLLIGTALPMMISMLVQALYNVVDSLYVARVSQEALNAVSQAFALQTLMIGLGVGTAVGTNAMLSRHLGAGNQFEAERSANTGLFLSILTSIVFIAIGFIVPKYYFGAINATSFSEAAKLTDEAARLAENARIQEIIDYGVDYCRICLALSMGFFAQSTFERMLTATGHSKLSMVCQLSGAITNIVLDPVFIFGVKWLHIPAMAVKGAAIATVIGQWVGGGLALFFVMKKVSAVRIRVSKLRLHLPTAAMIYKIGLPSIIMQCVSSVMNFCMNLILIQFTDTATAFFGVYYKLQSFVFMPVFGLNNGMVPVISYNYGAKKPDRVWAAIKFSMLIAIGIMTAGLIAFETIPGPLLRIFDAKPELMSMGKTGLRIIAVHFPIAGFCIVAASVFQSVGNPTHSLITSICRQLVVLLPAAWLLSFTGNVAFVWLAFPIAEIMSMIMSLFYMKKTVKHIRTSLPAEETAVVV